jgi:hypothetical protein
MEMGMEHGAWSMERGAWSWPRQTCARLPVCHRLSSPAIVCTHGNAARPTHTLDPRAGERVSECVWPARISIWREVTYFNSSGHGPPLASNPLLSVRADALASLHPPPVTHALTLSPYCSLCLLLDLFVLLCAALCPTRRPMHV